MLPEITEHVCTNCGAEVNGIFGRWSCTRCRTNSPYVEPPAAYARQLDNGTSPRRDPLPHHLCGEIRCVCPRLAGRRR
ncbi:hypothetical protein ACFP1Z_09905 [Streptomyces gamaensis]|uniref:Uncharacterized protein n=1 Tax=Streptomyces gamaensis TaxID=1763542 RepID=A0ABW0YYI4_9ACTN